MSLFEKGRAKTGGRAQGVRNKLGTSFLEALAKHFDEVGAKAIEIVFQERPVEYLKIVAATLPKEFEITQTKLMDISDDELEFLLDYARRRAADRLESREGETAH
jgi:hypothetical protein